MNKKKELWLSASSIKVYEKCPREYYYKHVEKLKVEKQVQPHLELGNFTHEVLDFFHKRLMKDSSLDKKILMSSLCKELVSKYKLDNKNKKKAKDMLATYLESLDKDGMPNVVESEKGFKINIGNNINLVGYIDRIDLEGESDKKFNLNDYKSGKSKHLDEFQLLVYGLYLLDEDPDVERFKGTYIVLSEDCKKIPYNFTRTDLDKVRKHIYNVADSIREDKTWEPKPQFLCKYCDFKEVCPASQFKVAANARREW